MKKLTVIVLLLSSFAIHESACAQSEKNTHFGIKGGLNISNLYTKDVSSENLRVGYHAGIFLKLGLSNYFAIQPELVYSTKGAQLKYNNDLLAGNADFNLNYLDIPVLAVVNITPFFNIHAGPYFSFLTNVKVKNNTEGSDAFDFENELNRSDFHTFDAGATVGLGVDFRRVSLGARYNYGFSNIGKERDFLGQSYRLPNAKNSLFQVYLSVNLL
jgi:hypothetical protein